MQSKTTRSSYGSKVVMTKTDTKAIRITIGIRPGKATPAMKTLWHKFFTRLIAECQHELKAENEAKK